MWTSTTRVRGGGPWVKFMNTVLPEAQAVRVSPSHYSCVGT